MSFQIIIVILIVILSVAYAIYRTWKALRESSDPCHGCHGCALRDKSLSKGSKGMKKNFWKDKQPPCKG